MVTVVANAQTVLTATTSGPWNSATTWGGSTNPGSGNTSYNYVIPSGITVTVSNAITAYGIININGGTLAFTTGGSLNTGNNNGTNAGGSGAPSPITNYGTALTTYNIEMTANGATLNTGGLTTLQPYNLTINTVNTTDVVTITGTTSSAPIVFGNNSNITGTLDFVKGLLNANGQYLTTTKNFYMYGGGTSSNFATSIDGTCLHPDADAGTFTFNGSSGSAAVLQAANVNFYNLTVANNMTFATGGDVTVLGTYTAQRTGNAGNPSVTGGVFRWGPNSLYVTTTGGSSTYTPNGEYTSPITSAGPAKTGTAPGTANSLYVTPAAIQTAITACSTPTITEANNSGGQQAAANISADGATNYPIANFQVGVSSSSATLNKVVFTTTGTATASDITNFQLWYNSANSFSGATSIGNISGAGAGTQTFSGLSQSIANGATGFFWITAQIPLSATVGRTITVGATPALTFASGTPTGTTSGAGAQTIQAPIPPTIVLASTSTVAAANLSAGSINNVVFNFNTAVTTSSAALNTVSFTTTGSATAADITNFQLWYNSTNSFAGATSIKTISGAGAGTQTFSGLSQAIASGAIGYFWITANIASGATVNDNFTVSAITPSNLTFALGTPSGSTTAGGTQTIVVPTTGYSQVTVNTSTSSGGTWSTSGSGATLLYTFTPNIATSNVNVTDIVNILTGTTATLSGATVTSGTPGSVTITSTCTLSSQGGGIASITVASPVTAANASTSTSYTLMLTSTGNIAVNSSSAINLAGAINSAGYKGDNLVLTASGIGTISINSAITTTGGGAGNNNANTGGVGGNININTASGLINIAAALTSNGGTGGNQQSGFTNPGGAGGNAGTIAIVGGTGGITIAITGSLNTQGGASGLINCTSCFPASNSSGNGGSIQLTATGGTITLSGTGATITTTPFQSAASLGQGANGAAAGAVTLAGSNISILTGSIISAVGGMAGTTQSGQTNG
ncbi:MAG TPA: hypothetical protein VNZ45_18030, partial [Bacteroidia bacterium]|nr:hypothetical protein [Bacteroidia bacterium]